MSVAQLIAAKRDGQAHSARDIRELINGFTDGRVPDYQMSAWLMAVYLRGMSDTETVELTQAMLQSGTQMHWPDSEPTVVDKHSTGGVGDKTSLIIAPLLAECGLQVPMISGRGLGPTGGTLDKLESIPGFQTQLSVEQLQQQVDSIGCIICGASPEIAPADRKMYALRDVTATVASIPLITASILSKKLAEGLDCLILDVKFGSGAFMKELSEARALARSLVRVGNLMGVRTRALLTSMEQPLGLTAGNALEVNECLDILAAKEPQEAGANDVRALSLRLAAELLEMSGRCKDVETGHRELEQVLASGRAATRFQQMVEAQGGQLTNHLPVAEATPVHADSTGFVHDIDTGALGQMVVDIGGGRQQVGDSIISQVGLSVHAKIGARVETTTSLADLHLQSTNVTETLTERIRNAFVIKNAPLDPPKLIVETIEHHD